MAAPVYSNDLVTIATGDLNYDAGTWDESSDGGWDTAGAMVDDLNLWYTENSTNTGEADNSCTSAQYTKDGTGSGTTGPGTIVYVHSAAFTVPADGVCIVHGLWAAPTSLNAYAGTPDTAEAGVSVLIGDDLADLDVFYASGSDKSPAPEGGWYTYAIDPTLTPDNTIGAGASSTTAVGIAIAATAQARGNPNAVQAIRYGRAEVEYTLGEAANPATFDGYAVIDNAAADRFNLFQIIPGGFQARGLMTFGTAATAVYFEDSDKSIVIADDPKVGPDFNAGIVNNANSELHWSNISISNLGSTAKYTFTVNDAAITNHIGGVFQDVGAFIYGANSTQIGAIYRRQELVTQNGSTFEGCKFENSIGAISLDVDDITKVTKNTFNSDGSNHAVDLGTYTDDASITWDNILSGYASSDGSTGNEAITVSVATGKTLTISVAATGTVPYINNTGAGTVTVVTGQVTITLIGLPDGIEVRFRQGSHTIQHTQNVTGGQVSYTYAYVADTRMTISFSGAGIIQSKTLDIILPSANQTSLVTFTNDPSYQ